jgi:hypothetical protein
VDSSVAILSCTLPFPFPRRVRARTCLRRGEDFSFQCLTSTVSGIQSDDWRVLSWMSPLEFTVFFAGLYGLSYLVSQYIDKPLSSWVSTRIVDATAHSTW